MLSALRGSWSRSLIAGLGLLAFACVSPVAWAQHAVYDPTYAIPDHDHDDHIDGGGIVPASDFPNAFRQFPTPFRWSNNANAAGFTGARGDAITLTYGVVPDGTNISGGVGEPASPSDLQAFLNANIGPRSVWQPLIDDAYGRWDELSGLTMIHEPNDDGNAVGGIDNTSNPLGVNGVRADMRIGGHFIDGQDGSNTLAYNYFPNNGDHVVDTGNPAFYSRSANNFRAFRNVFMHEAGHGLGFSHLESNNSSHLMEPFISTSFDGPQHDDILAVQRNYGDRFEENGGNDSFNRATPLGTLAPAPITEPVSSLAVGTDASDTTTFVQGDAIDFVSIDGLSDRDVFSFTLTDLGLVTLDLDPRGPTYNEGPQGGTQTPFVTKALADLALNLLDSTGAVLGVSNFTGAGSGETITQTLAAGDYFAIVRTGDGSADNVQLYELGISAILIPEPGTALVLLGGGALLLLRRRAVG